MTTIVDFIRDRLDEVVKRHGTGTTATDDPSGKPCPACGQPIERLQATGGDIDGVRYEARHIAWVPGDTALRQTLTVCELTRDQALPLESPRPTHLAAYIIADVAAKRRILDMFHFEPGEDGQLNVYGGNGPETWYDVLQELAATFAGHPDYDETWRP